MSNVTRKLTGRVGRLLLVYSLIFSQGAWAAQDQKAKDASEPAQIAAPQQGGEKVSTAAAAAKTQTEEVQGQGSEKNVAEGKPSGDGNHEGIKVHGHWTIEVRNPDGTLVTHREFENSIQTSGSAALTSLLVGNQLPGPWQVDLIGSPQPCVQAFAAESGFGPGPQPCVIVTKNTTVVGYVLGPGQTQVDAISFNLTVTASSGQLVLSGSATADTTTTVSSVATVLSPCINGGPIISDGIHPTTLPCSGLFFPIPAPFTAASLTQGVPVSTGQTIAVTVVISFS